MKLGTTEAGFGLCVLAVALIVIQILTGKGDFLQICMIAGGMLTAGYSSIKAADASTTLQKDDLKDLGMVGKELHEEVKERKIQERE